MLFYAVWVQKEWVARVESNRNKTQLYVVWRIIVSWFLICLISWQFQEKGHQIWNVTVGKRNNVWWSWILLFVSHHFNVEIPEFQSNQMMFEGSEMAFVAPVYNMPFIHVQYCNIRKYIFRILSFYHRIMDDTKSISMWFICR